jgi:hypothetical protein
MADIESNEKPPGFNVVEPGFHVFDDGSVAFANLPDAAAWVNEAVNGAYSVFPGVYNAGRAVALGTGLLGADEFRRFGQEADVIGAMLGNPRLWPSLGGRAIVGGLTGLGPAAMAGDALRAVEKGHNLADAFFYHGLQGMPSRDRR